MHVYKPHEAVEGMVPCFKRQILVRCKQINEDFRVDSLDGNYKQGNAGDYLIKDVDGELYICDRSVFERTYMVVDNDYQQGS